jgi:uncharacterized membrane protein YuzA (DUF378 family)
MVKGDSTMKSIDILTRILVIVGGLNWGLVGAANFDLVATLFGAGSVLAKVVYVLVGISAVIQLLLLASPRGAGSMTGAAQRL